MKVISKKDVSTKVEEQKNDDKKLQIKQVKLTKKIITKMVEATVERTPGYFRQFAKQYRYFICQREPIFELTLTKNKDHTVTKNLQLVYERRFL